MKLLDVNVLVSAFREDAPHHEDVREWLEEVVNGPESFGLSDFVLSGFVRVVTHPRVFTKPNRVEQAFDFVEKLRDAPTAVCITPGARHWDIFTSLCRSAGARGNLVPDAFLAALAIESGSELITFDGDFARFPGLRWSRPVA